MKALWDSAFGALESIGRHLLDSGILSGVPFSMANTANGILDPDLKLLARVLKPNTGVAIETHETECPIHVASHDENPFLSLTLPFFFRPLFAFLANAIHPASDRNAMDAFLLDADPSPIESMDAFFDVCGEWLQNRPRVRDHGACDEETARLPGALYERLLGYTPCVAGADLILTAKRSGRSRFDEAVPVKAGTQRRARRNNDTSRFKPKGAFFLMRMKNTFSRKGSGTYYTPLRIVRHMVEETVGDWWRGRPKRSRRTEAAVSGEEIDSFSVLDPAMGSGGFLITATTVLAARLYEITMEAGGQEAQRSLPAWRREVIRRCIHGVDKDPLALEMARMSLKLLAWDGRSTVSDAEMNLKNGDALFGISDAGREFTGGFEEADRFACDLFLGNSISGNCILAPGNTGEKDRRARARPPGDTSQGRTFFIRTASGRTSPGRISPGHTIPGRPMDAKRTGEDPSRTPGFFHWPLEFPKRFPAADMPLSDHESKQMMRTEAKRGFSVILSNPPYGDLLLPEEKDALKRFGYPPIGGRAEVAGHFLHQGLRLLEPGGVLSFIVPNTMIDGHQFGALRANLTARAKVASILDFAEEKVFPDAEVYAMILRLITDPDGARATPNGNRAASNGNRAAPEGSRAASEERRLMQDGGRLVSDGCFAASDEKRTAPDRAYDAEYQCPAPGTLEAKPERIRILPNSPQPWRKVLPFIDRLSRAGRIESLSPGIATCRDAGLDYKHKAVGWSRRGTKPRLKNLLTYEGARRNRDDLPLIRGRDIEPFRIAETRTFLIHDWRKIRDADTTVLVYEDLAEAPVKIVTRQTSDRLTAAIDRAGRYTAKSVHTVIVTNPDYTPEFVCALLNSSIMNDIYQAYTRERGRTFAQVKVSDLRLLPVRKTGKRTMGNEPLAREGNRARSLASAARDDAKPILDYVDRALSGAGEGEVQALVTELVRELERNGPDAATQASLIAVLDKIFIRLYENF